MAIVITMSMLGRYFTPTEERCTLPFWHAQTNAPAWVCVSECVSKAS